MSRNTIDHELTMTLMHLAQARYEARKVGDEALAESIEAVRLQVADLFDLNHIRAMREQLARTTADSMENVHA